MTTPYIDSLNEAQQALVRKKSLAEDRPSYFVAELNQETQISLDLEAVLILTPRETKQEMVNFITQAASEAADQDTTEQALVQEMVSVRRVNYGQVFTDAGSRVRSFQTSRNSLMNFIEESRSTGSDNTEVVIPQLSQFFSSISSAYNKYDRPDSLAIHDRITDSGFLTSTASASAINQELQSWLVVFNTYLL